MRVQHIEQKCLRLCIGGVPVVALMIRSVVELRVAHAVAFVVQYVFLNLFVVRACLRRWLR